MSLKSVHNSIPGNFHNQIYNTKTDQQIADSIQIFYAYFSQKYLKMQMLCICQ